MNPDAIWYGGSTPSRDSTSFEEVRDLREIVGTHAGDVTSLEGLAIVGLVSGSVRMLGGTLHIVGTVKKDVILDGTDAMALIEGTVGGAVRVLRGTAVITGHVKHTFARDPGVIVCLPGATVGGVRF